jgi:hypothetical protein
MKFIDDSRLFLQITSDFPVKRKETGVSKRNRRQAKCITKKKIMRE